MSLLTGFSTGGSSAAGEQTSFHNAEIKIERHVLRVLNGDCFIQIENIAHVRKGVVSVTTRRPVLIILGTVLLAVVIFMLGNMVFSINVAAVGAVVAIAIGSIATIKMTVSTNHHGLLVGLNSSVTYSFISNKDQVVDEAFKFLKQVINQEAYSGAMVFSFGHKRDVREFGDSQPRQQPALPSASRSDFDSKKFVDELLRTIDEIHYSDELGDQQKHLLIGIMMEAKSGIENNNHREMDQSRVRFRDFAYKTKATWPRLMESLSSRHNLVKFFSTNS